MSAAEISTTANLLTGLKREYLEAGLEMTIASHSTPKPHPIPQGQRSEAATTFDNGLTGPDVSLGSKST